MNKEPISIGNNILEFIYQTPQNQNLNYKLFDSKHEGVFYKSSFVDFPYLTTNHNLIKLDSNSYDEIFDDNNYIYQTFIIPDSQNNRADFHNAPHNFILRTSPDFKSGSNALEIRVKDFNGEWQDWQLIPDKFYVMKIAGIGSQVYLEFPIENFISDFRNYFEVRYSGIINVSKFGEISILSEDNNIYRYNKNTGRIEYKVDFANRCFSFEEKIREMKEFEERYFKYDDEDKRV